MSNATRGMNQSTGLALHVLKVNGPKEQSRASLAVRLAKTANARWRVVFAPPVRPVLD